MRDIKFRAFQKGHKRMSRITNVEFDRETGEIIAACFDNTSNGKHSIIPHFNWYRKNDEDWNLNNLEIMQYTGLKDKNGKEIYEGDIIQVLDKEDYPEPLILIGKVDSDKWGTWVFGYGYLQDFEGMYEVIGNIHENPELL